MLGVALWRFSQRALFAVEQPIVNRPYITAQRRSGLRVSVHAGTSCLTSVESLSCLSRINKEKPDESGMNGEELRSPCRDDLKAILLIFVLRNAPFLCQVRLLFGKSAEALD